jgi:hypothetical protein
VTEKTYPEVDRRTYVGKPVYMIVSEKHPGLVLKTNRYGNFSWSKHGRVFRSLGAIKLWLKAMLVTHDPRFVPQDWTVIELLQVEGGRFGLADMLRDQQRTVEEKQLRRLAREHQSTEARERSEYERLRAKYEAQSGDRQLPGPAR